MQYLRRVSILTTNSDRASSRSCQSRFTSPLPEETEEIEKKGREKEGGGGKEKDKKRKEENQLPKLISHGRVMESRNIPDGIYTSLHFIAAFNIETDLAIPDFN